MDIHPLRIRNLEEPKPVRVTARIQREIEQRPIQSLDDLAVQCNVFSREQHGGLLFFRASVVYSLIAYVETPNNYYSNSWRVSGTSIDHSFPHAYGCETFQDDSYSPLATEKHFKVLREDALRVVERRFKRKFGRNVLKVYMTKKEIFEEPFHMAFQIADSFNHKVGTAWVYVQGNYGVKKK
ncbi:MAG: hypothetical protein V1740_01355 [Candidatus Woesearchaeota archaeon]